MVNRESYCIDMYIHVHVHVYNVKCNTCSFNGESLFLNHEKCDQFIQILTEAGKHSISSKEVWVYIYIRTVHVKKLNRSNGTSKLRTRTLQ